MIFTHFIAFGFWPGAGDGSSPPVVASVNQSRIYIGISIRIALALMVIIR